MEPQKINQAEALATKPISWSVSAVAIALMLSLALNATLNSVQAVLSQYESTIATQEQQLATVVTSQRNEASKEAMSPAKAPESTDRIIVKFKTNDLPPGLSMAAERANLEKAQGLVRVLTINGIDAEVYRVGEGDTAQEVVDRLLASKKDLIEYAEVDKVVYPSYTPNDPYINNSVSWHHQKVDSKTAWDTTKGQGVTIAILDSGVNCSHPDLASNCVPGWNTMSNSSNTADVNGHGTMVAGTAASVGDNGVSGAGVAYQAKIMPVRLTDNSDGSATCSAIASGITYAANNGARVASNSYYIYGCSVVNDAAKYLESKGGVYIRAAGNFARNEDAQIPEGNLPQVTIVSATDQNDLLTSFSSWGTFVDVSAPGIGVYCTTLGGSTGSCYGTSFSVPITSGIYALMFSVNPALTPTQAKNILYSTIDDLGEPGWDMYYGYGRVNARKAVLAAAAAVGARDTVAPSIPQNLRATNVQSNSVTLAWNASTDDNSGIAGYTLFRDDTKLATIAGTSFTDSSVMPVKAYTYTVRAEDAQGNVSTTSDSLSVTTPDVSFAISSYSVSNKTTSGATIGVTLTKPGSVVVKYGTTATALGVSASSSTSGITHSVPLQNLAANTTYYYQVIATDSTGKTLSSPVSSFKVAQTKGGGKKR